MITKQPEFSWRPQGRRNDTISFAEIKSLALATYQEWSEDGAPRLGAALAYYTTLSLAPLLMIVIAIAGLVFGREAAQGQLFSQIRDMVGADGARVIEEMLAASSKPSSGLSASIIGGVMLLFGASSVVAELRSSLNIIWDVEQKNAGGLTETVKDRSRALAVVLACGFLLLVSLAVSAGLAAMGSFTSNLLPLPEVVLTALNFVVSLSVITCLFAILFKYLPEVEIAWHNVWLGAAVTAVLFTIGKFALGMYLGKASFGSTYGAAGSLVILLVWIYYSSQIFFFGAEFTQVYTRRRNRAAGGQRQQVEEAKPPSRPVPAATQPPASQPAHSSLLSGLGMLIGSALVFGRARRGVKKDHP